MACEPLASGADTAMDAPLEAAAADARLQLNPRECLGVFEEEIDYNLEAAVPDPVSFETKLRAMLDDHEPFIIGSASHAVGAEVLAEVGLFSVAVEGAENKVRGFLLGLGLGCLGVFLGLDRRSRGKFNTFI